MISFVAASAIKIVLLLLMTLWFDDDGEHLDSHGHGEKDDMTCI